MVKAAEWYRKAAEQGLSEAQNTLGICYDNGEGVEMDMVKVPGSTSSRFVPMPDAGSSHSPGRVGGTGVSFVEGWSWTGSHVPRV